MQTLQSAAQRALFEAVATCGELIFAAGPDGVSANIVGPFRVVARRGGAEDRLEMGDGTQHVHVDWRLVERCEVDAWHGEGRLTLLRGDQPLFRLYRPAGSFPAAVAKHAGPLLDG